MDSDRAAPPTMREIAIDVAIAETELNTRAERLERIRDNLAELLVRLPIEDRPPSNESDPFWAELQAEAEAVVRERDSA